eukprot:TRINITY_DN23279_c0_g1_i1.p1 TRINITY_DN23279_c0_g1~~TRINITY_DN23279_c0_g1_i1.p1  ORF type:complete len:372 (+),score=-7.06 TRINITY_DN23279_c0_g1_i1:55-1170(+)
MPKEEKCCKQSCCMKVIMFAGLFLALFPAFMTWKAGDPMSFMYPNFLLFTPFRQQAIDAWKSVLHINRAVRRHHTHVPEIDAKDYTFEALKFATNNFRHPAIVRGLFKGTNAVEKWTQPGYLASKIGHFNIPVVNNALYGTLQNDRTVGDFGSAFEEILQDVNSKKYLFFPVKSRFNFNGSSTDADSHEKLQSAVNQLLLDDLEIHKRIWNGFGTPYHKKYVGGQLILGRGSNSSDVTTGTGWHCAAGNNYFIQVAGKKRWYLMDPEYSAFMSPLRGGMVNMMTGNRGMSEIHPHLPLKYADVEAGDLLYNPDWEWHTIKNYEGLSIGCPIRELNITHTFRNNFQYTTIIMINKLLDAMGGLSIGGYPPAN